MSKNSEKCKTPKLNEEEMQIFIEALRDKPESITDFDEELWVKLVEKVEASQKSAWFYLKTALQSGLK